jgi:tetratricopeptide (TPR) repeat protein
MKTKYPNNLIEDTLFTRMTSGVIKVGLVALIGTMITVGMYGCKKSEDYYNRGLARFKKGETDGAISDFTKAIKKRPRYGMAYYYRGMVNTRKKEYDQVIADYTKAIEIDPQRFAVAYAERALIYYVKKEYDKAWEDVHKAESLGVEVRPGFLKALRNPQSARTGNTKPSSRESELRSRTER